MACQLSICCERIRAIVPSGLRYLADIESGGRARRQGAIVPSGQIQFLDTIVPLRQLVIQLVGRMECFGSVELLCGVGVGLDVIMP